MNRSWARYILPLLLLVGGVAWCAQSRKPPVSSAPAPSPSVESTDAATALLGGLKPGDTIDEWTVDRVVLTKTQKEQPQLAIEFTRKGSGITVWLARKAVADNPPLATQRYGISYGDARPYGDPIPADALTTVGANVADRVRANETTTPVPQGL